MEAYVDTLCLLTQATEGQQSLKRKYNQNCQKIELYKSLTTKELKKKHSSRQVEGAETGSWGGEDSWQDGGWQSRWSHTCLQINQEEQLGSETE